MEIPQFVQAVATGLGAVETLKRLLPKLPDPKDKEEAERALHQTEIAFQVAQAEVAMKLDYPICRRHWPPVIMLMKGYRNAYTEEYECPDCKAKWPGPELPPLD